MPNLTLKLPPNGSLHKKIVAMVASRIRLAEKGHSKRHDKWRKAEESALAYIPESDADAVRRNRRDSTGAPTYTTIQLPYSYALLMSAHTYWTSVFFARDPVHQYSGRHGEGEMQVQALEALISYQVEVGEMMGPYYIWLYDAGKYGLGVLGQYWDKEKIHYGQIVEMTSVDGQTGVYQATQEVDGYQGNKVYNVSPYDFMHDPRVPIGQFQRGEFCCSRRRMGWTDILRRQDQGYFMNVDQIKEHVSDKSVSDGSSKLERPDFGQMELDDYDMEGNKDVKHPAGAVFWEFYVELVPSEWGVGTEKFPQKWCFTITEDLELLVGATPLGYMHGKFPFDILETEIEAYGLYNRGIPEIMEPIQNTMDWLLNTHFFNVRASMNNQFIVDPSKLVIKDVQNTGPGFLWRLRPEAYGADISKLFHQVTVQDMTRAHMTDLAQMVQIGERTLGINDQIMGALSSSGRKTATEVRTSTGFGVNRLKTVSEYMSATGFATHSQKMVQSSQQYYDVRGKLRIVGDLILDAGQKFIDVGPEDIAGFYSFVPVDGVLPVDRMAQANLWKEIFAGLRMMPPTIAQGYDWPKMFGWMATLGGLKNIHRFKIQVVPDQQLIDQEQSGNVIPLRGNSGATPGNTAATQNGLNSMTPQLPPPAY